MAGRTLRVAAFFAAGVFLLASCSTPVAPLPRELPLSNPDAEGRTLPSVFNPSDLGMTLAELRSRYPTLREWGDPINVEYRGQTRGVDLSAGCFRFGPSGECRQPQIEVDQGSGGTAVMAIYYVPARWEGYTSGYLFPDTLGVLAPIYLLVCADVPGQGEHAIPKTVAQMARVCGFQGFHHTHLSEYAGNRATRLEEANNPSPMYERVFDGLVNLFGKPQGFEKHGKVVIILDDGSRYSSDAPARFIDYHWGQGVSETNIDYSFNPRDGEGIVYVSSPLARAYAEKRHGMGDVNFVLWRLHQRGGMNNKQLETHYQPGSLAETLLEARARYRPGVSEYERQLFAAQPESGRP